MCGLSCVVSKVSSFDVQSIITSMNAEIFHRGPDSQCLYLGNKVGLGHTRLSIIDLSDAANQPFIQGKYVLIFNGEIYNYIELREELKQKGYNFTTTSDTEVIIAAFDFWGKDCQHKFNGMWAFILFNKESNTIFYSRDRFGIKPLYVYEDDKVISFASEIKQFLALPSFVKSIDFNTVEFFFAGKLNQSKNTFFSNVKVVPGGHCGELSVKQPEVNVSQWYSLTNAIKVQNNLSEREIVSETKRLFLDSLKLRVRSDVPVGSCLSGGLDSSAIVCGSKKSDLVDQDFTTITSSYNLEGYSETEFSDFVAKQSGVSNNKVYPDLKSLVSSGLLEKINFHQDQPIPSASHVNEYEVFKKANQLGLKVMLDGQGADEYFLGYPEFERQHFIDLCKSGKVISAISFLNNYVKYKSNYSFFKELKFTFSDIINRRAPWKSVMDLSLDEMLMSSLPYQLHSEDRNSMLHSVESRLPFLDYRLVEFVMGVRSSLKLKKGKRKYLIREAFDFLPSKIRNRMDKIGFVAPDFIVVEENASMIEKVKDILQESGFLSHRILNSSNTTNHQFRILSYYTWLKAFKFL